MLNKVEDLPVRSLAHIGDAVYEVFAREITVSLTQNPKKMHQLTVSIVNAQYQAELLEQLVPHLSEAEAEIVRRARNLQVTTARRTNQKLHRLSTAFESLIGYLHYADKDRLHELLNMLRKVIESKFSQI